MLIPASVIEVGDRLLTGGRVVVVEDVAVYDEPTPAYEDPVSRYVIRWRAGERTGTLALLDVDTVMLTSRNRTPVSRW